MMRTALGRYPITYDFAGDADPITPLLAAYRSAGNTVFSGASSIIPEPGTTFDKVEGAVRLTRRFVDTALDDFLDADDQETRFRVLRSVPGIGKFLAMQILTDWGYGATENPENDFIVAGPGAQRGALYLDPNTPAEEVIHRLTEEWDGQPTVRIGSHSLTLMDVQNTLCEFSKVMRYYDGKPVPKTLYRPAHPGPQPKPVLPVWVP
jgi:hypothetical protein